MDDAGAVFISSCEYCFYQTEVDIRTRVSTLWPCKRQRKRETFVRFQHFYLILSSDSAVSQRAFFLPIPALGLDLLVNQNYMTYLLYRHVNEMCVPQTGREVALCLGLLMKSYFLNFFLDCPGRLCDLWQWVRIVGRKKKKHKKPWHSLKIDAGCELEGQRHSFSPSQHLFYSTTNIFDP